MPGPEPGRKRDQGHRTTSAERQIGFSRQTPWGVADRKIGSTSVRSRASGVLHDECSARERSTLR